MLDANLIREFGPIAVFWGILAATMPLLIQRAMGVVDSTMKARSDLAAQPFEIIKTSLENRDQMNLLIMEFMGVKSRQDQIIDLQKEHNAKVDQILTILKGQIK